MGKTLEGVWIYTSALRRGPGARATVKTPPYARSASLKWTESAPSSGRKKVACPIRGLAPRIGFGVGDLRSRTNVLKKTAIQAKLVVTVRVLAGSLRVSIQFQADVFARIYYRKEVAWWKVKRWWRMLTLRSAGQPARRS